MTYRGSYHLDMTAVTAITALMVIGDHHRAARMAPRACPRDKTTGYTTSSKLYKYVHTAVPVAGPKLLNALKHSNMRAWSS